jgi:hypothetical protein
MKKTPSAYFSLPNSSANLPAQKKDQNALRLPAKKDVSVKNQDLFTTNSKPTSDVTNVPLPKQQTKSKSMTMRDAADFMEVILAIGTIFTSLKTFFKK